MGTKPDFHSSWQFSRGFLQKLECQLSLVYSEISRRSTLYRSLPCVHPLQSLENRLTGNQLCAAPTGGLLYDHFFRSTTVFTAPRVNGDLVASRERDLSWGDSCLVPTSRPACEWEKKGRKLFLCISKCSIPPAMSLLWSL